MFDIEKLGDDAADVLSTSDALIGGDEPSGDGLGGEPLALRRPACSFETVLLLLGGGAFTYPLDLAAGDAVALGADVGGFFVGDFRT